MTRMTGFIVFVAAIVVAVAAVILSGLHRMPEPYAGCVDTHRERPDIALGRMYDADLILDEERSGVEEDAHDGIGYRTITARVSPAPATAGDTITLTCYEVDGHGSLILQEETLREMVGME
ncbi:hypothetical protein QWY84_18695 [Aquisalimonas lutea]|uniref:hypothetical protein n=1 Tax=Aquisalimonas lutea TaxID=1327750 RepID=UPI0025B34DC8|nr:hypothetical protein [Aquisalimonas lutea]MDN3519641.1 hypothetical protein [Aquisalimonas lutea]